MGCANSKEAPVAPLPNAPVLEPLKHATRPLEQPTSEQTSVVMIQDSHKYANAIRRPPQKVSLDRPSQAEVEEVPMLTIERSTWHISNDGRTSNSSKAFEPVSMMSRKLAADQTASMRERELQSERSTSHISDGDTRTSNNSLHKTPSSLQAASRRLTKEQSSNRHSRGSRSTRSTISRIAFVIEPEDMLIPVVAQSSLRSPAAVIQQQLETQSKHPRPAASEASHSSKNSQHPAKHGQNSLLSKTNKYEEERTALDLLSSEYKQHDERKSSKHTSLMLAAEGSHGTIVQALVAAGADVIDVDKVGSLGCFSSAHSDTEY